MNVKIALISIYHDFFHAPYMEKTGINDISNESCHGNHARII
jgi:hypothetical protein